MKLSVVIPVFNEEQTIEKLIDKVMSDKIPKEVIAVDDCSTDKTPKILKQLSKKYGNLKTVFLSQNKGKGHALRVGFTKFEGDMLLIQDADLEYDPSDYPELIKPIIEEKADVVFGSRLVAAKPHRVLYFWHWLANSMLTLLTNFLYNTNLSDMETGYKVFSKRALKSLNLKSDRFEIEPEITAKVFKGHWRVFEVPISYSGRSYEEGKKITWIDGVKALFSLIKYRFTD